MPHLHKSQLLEGHVSTTLMEYVGIGMFGIELLQDSSKCLPSCAEIRPLHNDHNQVKHLPNDLNSEMLNLLSYNINSKVHKKVHKLMSKIQRLRFPPLPDHILEALQARALITTDRSASDACFNFLLLKVMRA